MEPKNKPGAVPTSRRTFLQHTAAAGVVLASQLPGLSWAVENRVLHIRNYNDIASLDPPFGISGAEGTIGRAIYHNLLMFTADGTWDSELDAAEYFERIDDAHYAFRLKPGIRFSNGFGEMTADDVKFSFERIIDPKLNALNAPDMGTLSHVDVHDRYSGTLVLNSPYAAFVPVGVAGPSGAILSRKAVNSVGGRFSTQPPCCSGPYQFKSWQAKRKTILERNPLWNGPEAPFDEMHVYAMNDDKAAEMAFEAGQLDSSLISVESTGPLRKNPPPNSYVETYPSARNYWLGMNQSHPKLQDIRVRQAIQYAVDVDAVIEAAWFGLAEPSTGPVPQGMIGHRANALIPPEGDRERARQLLREAGVSLPLKLRLDVNSSSLEMTAVQVIQWSLSQIGIEIQIYGQDDSTFLSLGMEETGDQWQDLELFFASFIGLADPYYSLVWFTTQQMGQWNWERFSDPEFDQLNDQAVATTDASERDRMYQRMQDLMERSGCYRFITNGVMPQIMRRTITPAFRPDGYPMLRDFKPTGPAA